MNVPRKRKIWFATGDTHAKFSKSPPTLKTHNSWRDGISHNKLHEPSSQIYNRNKRKTADQNQPRSLARLFTLLSHAEHSSCRDNHCVHRLKNIYFAIFISPGSRRAPTNPKKRSTLLCHAARKRGMRKRRRNVIQSVTWLRGKYRESTLFSPFFLQQERRETMAKLPRWYPEQGTRLVTFKQSRVQRDASFTSTTHFAEQNAACVKRNRGRKLARALLRIQSAN